jgi:hypothetical protein
MRTKHGLPILLVSISALALGACGNLVSLGGGDGNNLDDPEDGQGGAATSVSGGGDGGGNGDGGDGGATSTSTGPGPECGNDPNVDGDGDGFTPSDGDCNDCEPLINPNAVETLAPFGDPPADDDCNGVIDDIYPLCDSGLAVDDPDPLSGAKAVDLCKVSAGPNDWGVVEAKWAQPDGSAPPAGFPDFHLGHGILSAFGPNVDAQRGVRMLGLSSGAARQPTDPGYHDPTAFAKGYSSGSPQGFPKPSPACPGVVSGAPYDGAALEIEVRTPSNATGFAFDFSFYTYEWPSWICTTFNDIFVALLSPAPVGQSDANISFDNQGNIITVNNVFLEGCACPSGPPCDAGGKSFTCALGASELVGTGFGIDTSGQDHGTTSWLTTTAPVEPGSTIVIRWGIQDSGDGAMDSTTLVDGWRWITSGSPPVATVRKQMP